MNTFNLLKEYVSKESTLAEWMGIIGTFILGALAISGDQIRKSIFKPNLQPVEIIKTHQRIGKDVFVYQRLIIKNTGCCAAKEVRILLTYKEVPGNFIPIPIAWTHWRTLARNISQNEPAYVDVLRKENETSNYDFCWSPEAGIPYEKSLREFNSKFGDLRLEFFEHDRKIGDITLKFSINKDILEIESNKS